MSKSQNTKNEQLIEQLKNGELKLGEHYYYTTIFSPDVHIQNFTRDVISFKDFTETVAEVIAPVPSYKEWLEKTKSLKVLAEAYCKEKQKNDEIKDLLKECKTPLKVYNEMFGNKEELLTKIDEVLK